MKPRYIPVSQLSHRVEFGHLFDADVYYDTKTGAMNFVRPGTTPIEEKAVWLHVELNSIPLNDNVEMAVYDPFGKVFGEYKNGEFTFTGDYLRPLVFDASLVDFPFPMHPTG